mmetsp:Transcript_122375/g.280402  ORF Transcript_122375/g.280402 Transcript_122375/m.280402 type:complete len:461 (-) Transcript_122375:398-1780(-)
MLKERDFGLPRDAQEKRVAVGYELVVPSQPPARDGWNNPRRVLKGWIRSGRQWPRVSSPRVREESEGVPPSFNRVCFPIFALALQCFLEKIRKQSHRCDYLKIFFLTGAHQVLAEGGETFSTFSAGELLSMWAEQQLKELTSEALTHNVRVQVQVVHSGSGIFVYDENVRFVNQFLLPKVDDARELAVQEYRSAWSGLFHVTTTLAEGAPARVSAITQSLIPFRPAYIHILRPKTFAEKGVLFEDGVEFLNFEAASAVPSVRIPADLAAPITGSSNTDMNLRRLVREMIEHKRNFDLSVSAETVSFWLRKSQQPVLAVLMVQKAHQTARFFRGINLEVSMPTGSLCAERSVIGTALAQDPSLHRSDFKMIAVLAAALQPVPPSPAPLFGSTTGSPSPFCGIAGGDPGRIISPFTLDGSVAGSSSGAEYAKRGGGGCGWGWAGGDRLLGSLRARQRSWRSE